MLEYSADRGVPGRRRSSGSMRRLPGGWTVGSRVGQCSLAQVFLFALAPGRRQQRE